MHIRTYHPNDLAQMAQLFYDTVHAVCAQDYAPQQLRAWADGKPDLALWQQRFQNSLTLVMEEKGALIGFAGPRVVEQTIGQKLPEGFQRSEFQQEHGTERNGPDRFSLPKKDRAV